MQMHGKRNNDKISLVGTKGFRPELKAVRRENAERMIAEWRTLTPVQQIAALDRRLGVGVGAKKQRARIKEGATLDGS